jgi:hypothetical protein
VVAGVVAAGLTGAGWITVVPHAARLRPAANAMAGIAMSFFMMISPLEQ